MASTFAVSAVHLGVHAAARLAQREGLTDGASRGARAFGARGERLHLQGARHRSIDGSQHVKLRIS